MEIGSLATTAGDGAAYTRSSNPDVTTTTTQNGVANTDAGSSTTPASQDDAVEISPQGYAAASNDASAGTSAGASAGASIDTSADDTDDPTDQSTDASTAAQGSTTAGESADQANAQPMRSLVYGALGLARPDQPPDPNHAYSFGRWVAAGITIGGLISLFI
ncbi:hypothetical protein [Paraburkholderia bannensis]|uniref:hypothetical protein n=1 Tax=Paraburkholderia bannensis TaxID=765414 RepID=UPI002AB2908A|nr:hypothetical protein [Paraburkholderia bannensis]